MLNAANTNADPLAAIAQGFVSTDHDGVNPVASADAAKGPDASPASFAVILSQAVAPTTETVHQTVGSDLPQSADGQDLAIALVPATVADTSGELQAISQNENASSEKARNDQQEISTSITQFVPTVAAASNALSPAVQSDQEQPLISATAEEEPDAAHAAIGSVVIPIEEQAQRLGDTAIRTDTAATQLSIDNAQAVEPVETNFANSDKVNSNVVQAVSSGTDSETELTTEVSNPQSVQAKDGEADFRQRSNKTSTDDAVETSAEQSTVDSPDQAVSNIVDDDPEPQPKSERNFQTATPRKTLHDSPSAASAAVAVSPRPEVAAALSALNSNVANATHNAADETSSQIKATTTSTSGDSQSVVNMLAGRSQNLQDSARATAATVEPAEVTRQVVDAALEHIEVTGDVEDTLTVRLDPPELGEITLEMESRGNRTVLKVTAAEAATQTMLQNSVADLKAADATDSPLAEFEFEFNDEPQEQQQDQREKEAFRHWLVDEAILQDDESPVDFVA